MNTGETRDDYLESFLTSAFGVMDDDPSVSLARPLEEPTPDLLGRYPVVGTIGRGGVGIVYRVVDPELGRDLAMKVLRSVHAHAFQLCERFIEEARICSRLQHPGVVPVHEVGRLEDGRPYFTMKIVEGQTLAELLAGRRPDERRDARRELETFHRIGETLAYVHSHGVVHGDLKPQNVMVGAFGEVQVMDWGFASHVGPLLEPEDGDGPRTRVIGTPAYMAPEQARGDVGHVTSRTDVFGLGAILCEILSGAPPYLAATKADVCTLAAQGDLSDARRRLAASGEDAALIDLSLRCMAPDPRDRPADAAVVATAIGEHLAGIESKARALELEAAEARAAAAQERRARRLTIALAATVGAAILAVAAGVVWIERDRSNRRSAVEQRIAATVERAELLRNDARTAAPGRRDLWAGARGAAHEAAALADSGDADPRTRGRVDLLVEEIETEAAAAARDAALLQRLTELRPHLGDDRPRSALDDEYEDLFASFGVAGPAIDVEAAARRIEHSSILGTLVESLDEWAHHRRRSGDADGDTWRSLVELANRIDGDPWRRELRDAWSAGDVERLRALASDASIARATPVDLDLLARCLVERGDRPTAVAVYRRAARLHPGDFWIHHNLATQLNAEDPRPSDEIVRHLSMAVAVRPESAHALTDLAFESAYQERFDEAIETLLRALELEPGYARASFLLGTAYARRNDFARAADSYRDALRGGMRQARSACIQTLVLSGHADEAMRIAREALALDPDGGVAHYLVAALLADDYEYAEALEHATKAVRLDATLAEAHGVRAVCLVNQGDFEAALAALVAGRDVGSARGEPLSFAYHRWIPIVSSYIKTRPELDRVRSGDVELANVHPERLVILAEIALSEGDGTAADLLFDAAHAIAPAVLGRDDVAFDVARAAALAATQTDDASAAARCEERAREWLSIDVERLAAASRRDGLAAEAIFPAIRRWTTEPHLAALFRDREGWRPLATRIDSVREELMRRQRGEAP